MDKYKMPGIYGFVENGEIVYIGYTARPIEVRIQEHYNENLDRLQKKIYQGGIYQRSLDFHKRLKEENLPVCVIYSAKEGDDVYFLQSLEEYYIKQLCPKYNSAGVICDYYYSEGTEINWSALREYQLGYSWESSKNRAKQRLNQIKIITGKE